MALLHSSRQSGVQDSGLFEEAMGHKATLVLLITNLEAHESMIATKNNGGARTKSAFFWIYGFSLYGWRLWLWAKKRPYRIKKKKKNAALLHITPLRESSDSLNDGKRGLCMLGTL